MKCSSKAILLCITLCLFASSCSSYSTLFQKGRTWKYQVSFYNKNNELEDSALIKMVVKSNWVASLVSQIPIVYYYTLDSLSYEEKTGAIDNKNQVSIHSPRFGKLKFTEVLPMPTISKPIGYSFNSIITTTVSKSTMKILNGKEVKQKAEYLGEDSIALFGKAIPCFKIKAENLNLYDLVGHYEAYYWFNKKYGFVRLLYIEPSGNRVDIRLAHRPYIKK